MKGKVCVILRWSPIDVYENRQQDARSRKSSHSTILLCLMFLQPDASLIWTAFLYFTLARHFAAHDPIAHWPGDLKMHKMNAVEAVNLSCRCPISVRIVRVSGGVCDAVAATTAPSLVARVAAPLNTENASKCSWDSLVLLNVSWVWKNLETSEPCGVLLLMNCEESTRAVLVLAVQLFWQWFSKEKHSETILSIDTFQSSCRCKIPAGTSEAYNFCQEVVEMSNGWKDHQTARFATVRVKCSTQLLRASSSMVLLPWAFPPFHPN